MYEAWGSKPVFVAVVVLEIVAAIAMVLTSRAVERAEGRPGRPQAATPPAGP